MRIRQIMCAMLCTAGLLTAGQDTANQETMKIVHVRSYPNSLAGVVFDPSVSVRQSDAMKVIVLRGKPDAVARVEATIRELDSSTVVPVPAARPTGNVETTVFIVGGSNEPMVGAQEIKSESLLPVVRQLRSIFPYNHYQLLTTMVMRSAQDSSAESNGIMKTLTNDADFSYPSAYAIRYDSVKSTNDSPTYLEMRHFKFQVRVPISSGRHSATGSDGKPIPYATTQFNQFDVSVSTDINLRDGQKVVVGKANVADSDTCFFVVLSAHLVP